MAVYDAIRKAAEGLGTKDPPERHGLTPQRSENRVPITLTRRKGIVSARSCARPGGGLWPVKEPISRWWTTGAVSDEPDTVFARRMTVEYGVAAIPPSVFYHERDDPHVLRFCFAKNDAHPGGGCRQAMPHLKIALVQTELAWEDPGANRARFDERLATLDGAPDLVVLPEMFTTGFTMAGPRLAETMDGPSVEWSAQQRRPPEGST